MRRPVLAWLLDLEEARLPAPDPTTPRAGANFAAMVSVLSRADLTGSVNQIATDLMVVTRGLADLAKFAGDVDATDLERRMHRAVFGCIEAVKLLSDLDWGYRVQQPFSVAGSSTAYWSGHKRPSAAAYILV